jgi:hypothetical protein
MRTLAILLLLLTGCKSYVAGPSTSVVQSDIRAAQAGNKEISTYNVQARSLAQRIHDKDVLIDRWNATHNKEKQ